MAVVEKYDEVMYKVYKSIVESSMKKFKITTSKKLMDANSFKDNLNTPLKCFTTYFINKMIFMKTIGLKCDEGQLPLYTIKSTKCMTQIFGGSNIIKQNCVGDISLATPVCC